MSIGTLNANVQLDNEDCHYGNGVPVTGKVLLSYLPNPKTKPEAASPDLFGPLKIHITFHGRAKTKIRETSGQSGTIHRARVPLFRTSKLIFDDVLRAEPGKQYPIAFEVQFPEVVADAGIDLRWKQDERFNTSSPQTLPPSFRSEHAGFGKVSECFVEYRVGVEVSMPQLPVEINLPEKYDEPLVRYDVPRPEALLPDDLNKRSEHVTVRNALLLPEKDRASGFRAKAKAAFDSRRYPTYAFTWQCIGPQHLYRGSPVRLQFRIQPDDKNTAVVVPDVTLKNIEVKLEAITACRAEKVLLASPDADRSETIAVMGTDTDYGERFSKASDLTKTLSFKPVKTAMYSSFRTFNISHTHRLDVIGSFELAGEVKSFKVKFPVMVHPPLARSAADNAAASSSTITASLEPDSLPRYVDDLPRYEAASVKARREGETITREQESP